MSKAVMLSIRPKWCKKIASGEKTIEVRKTRPKLDTPFKCYIYCTSGRPDLNIPISPERLIQDYLDTGSMKSLNCPLGNGKVIGEFTCERIYEIRKRGIPENFDYCYLSLNEWGNDDIETEIRAISASCVSKEKLNAYGAKAPLLYGWHISDLKIYDKPRELREFKKSNRDCFYADLGLAKRDCPDCKNSGCFLDRPPQCWCYVEAMKDG